MPIYFQANTIPRLLLILDREATDPVEATKAACAAGARLIQWRDKALDARAFFEVGREVAMVCAAYNAALVVNDRVDVARLLAATGVHLPARGLPVGAVRAALGPDRLIGVSTHDIGELGQAAGLASYVTHSPVWESPSKPGYGPPVGVEGLRQACAASTVPVFALGGVSVERVPECLAAGARGVAVMSGVMRAEDIFEATRAYLDALGE